jgi:hypothetical protein
VEFKEPLETASSWPSPERNRVGSRGATAFAFAFPLYRLNFLYPLKNDVIPTGAQRSGGTRICLLLRRLPCASALPLSLLFWLSSPKGICFSSRRSRHHQAPHRTPPRYRPRRKGQGTIAARQLFHTRQQHISEVSKKNNYRIFAQKSHVKPQNHVTHSLPTTSEWHFSYAQPAILDIDRKTNKPRPTNRG